MAKNRKCVGNTGDTLKQVVVNDKRRNLLGVNSILEPVKSPSTSGLKRRGEVGALIFGFQADVGDAECFVCGLVLPGACACVACVAAWNLIIELNFSGLYSRDLAV